MKIAAVSMVKNECDIIELFIKINSRFFDAIYILDHGSTDFTSKIIRLMKEDGFNIFYTLVKDRIYNQSTITSNAVNQIARLELYDFIMPIDADEFIPNNDIEKIKQFLKEKINSFDIGYLPWKTYCPIEKNYFESEAPLYNKFKARRSEINQYYKIIISNKLAKECKIEMGNHDIKHEPRFGYIKKNIVPSHLIHTPIRSEEQIISKAILGNHAFKLKKDRKPGEGFHWDELAKIIRSMNYSIPSETLSEMAANYAMPQIKSPKNIALTDLIELNSDPIGKKNDSINFPDLAKINLIKNLDEYISYLIKT